MTKGALCSVCVHPERINIEYKVHFWNADLAAIATEYNVSQHSLRAHRRDHENVPLHPLIGTEVAAELGITSTQLTSLRREGKGPAFIPRGGDPEAPRVFAIYDADEVKRWKEENAEVLEELRNRRGRRRPEITGRAEVGPPRAMVNGELFEERSGGEIPILRVYPVPADHAEQGRKRRLEFILETARTVTGLVTTRGPEFKGAFEPRELVRTSVGIAIALAVELEAPGWRRQLRLKEGESIWGGPLVEE